MMQSKFPLAVTHHRDEPAHGLLLRTAAHNGTRMFAYVFKRYGVRNGFLANNVDPAEVALACHADPAAVAHASPVTSSKSVSLLGQTMHRDHYSVMRRRWCPECLKEEPYHRATWDVVAITTCPKHGVELADRCECGGHRTWQSYGVTFCSLGHDLRLVETKAVTPEETEAERYLEARLIGVNSAPSPLLDSITLGEVIIALERIGQAWHSEAKGLRRARADVGVRELINTGYRIMRDFRTAGPALLDRMVENPARTRGKWGVTKFYGDFYYWVEGLPASLFVDTLRAAISEHAQANLMLKTGMRLADDTTIDNGYLLKEAAALCGVAPNKFRRMAVELDLMPPERKRGQPARLDRAKVQEIADRFRGAMNLNEIAAALGTTPEVVRSMTKDGLLLPLLHAGTSGLNQYEFASTAADELLAKLDALPMSAAIDGDRNIPLPLAAQQARVTVSKGVSMILEGAVAVVALNPKGKGLQRYLVSASQITLAARRSGAPGLSMVAAAPLLDLSYNSTADFVRKGIIATVTVGKVTYVTQAEIDKFKRTYVTVPEISEIVGVLRSRETISLLSRAGLEPACQRPAFYKVLYRREEAMRVARSLVSAD